MKISWFVILVVTAFPPVMVDAEAPPPGREGFERVVIPILKENCLRCHGPEKSKGDFRVDQDLSLDFNDFRNVEKWTEVLDNVNGGDMPPDDEPPLAQPQARAFSAWITAELRRAEADRQSTGGRVVLRRMNRAEYRNTIRDLTGLDFDPAADFPEDPPAHGFDNIGQALTVSPLLFEQYLKAARQVVERAIVTGPRPRELTWRYDVHRPGPIPARERNPDSGLNSQTALVRFGKGPVRDGMYEMQSSFRYVNGWGRDAIRIWGTPIHHEGTYAIRVRAASKPVPSRENLINWWQGHRDRVRQDRRGAIERLLRNDPVFEYGRPRIRIAVYGNTLVDAEVSNPPNEPGIYEARFEGELTGANRDHSHLEVLIANSYLIPTPEPILRANLAEVREMPQPELLVESVEITGPVFESWPPPSHRRILFDSPRRDSDEVGYAREVLARFMGRAWRRTAERGEVEAKLALFKMVRPDASSFEEAIRVPLVAVLTSPHFIYLVESSTQVAGPAPDTVESRIFTNPKGQTITAKALGLIGDRVLLEMNGKRTKAAIGLFSEQDQAYLRKLPPVAADSTSRSLTDFELASRLSYFLWSSMPDDELFELAAAGRLHSPEALEAQVDRMLADARSEAFVSNFAGQWLGLRDADANPPSQQRFPYYTQRVHFDLIREGKAFFDEILRKDLSVLNFLDSKFVVINDNLARFYGIPGVRGSEFRPVAIPEGKPRGGLLGLGVIHGLTSNGTRTSPVDRGVWILERILGDPPPPPPPDAGDLAPRVPGIDQASVRERLAAHREIAQCASCHQKIDPLGFALENYGPDGRWRDRESYRDHNLSRGSDPVIDANGKLPDGTVFAGPGELKKLLLARREQFLVNFTEHLLIYALGRGLEVGDRDEVTRLVRQADRDGHVMRELIKDIVQSEAFLTK